LQLRPLPTPNSTKYLLVVPMTVKIASRMPSSPFWEQTLRS
jgi:hypothetical protein